MTRLGIEPTTFGIRGRRPTTEAVLRNDVVQINCGDKGQVTTMTQNYAFWTQVDHDI